MIKILNKAEIDKNLTKQLKIVSETLEEGLEETGERAVEILRRNTPTISNRLRSSMSYTTDNKVVDPLGAFDNNDKLRKIKENDKIVVGTNVVYAPRVEYMAKNGSAGFMLRSYKQLIPIAKAILGKAFKRRFK